MDNTLESQVDAYVDEVWEDVVADIARLVEHPSVADASAGTPGSPFGAPVRVGEGALVTFENVVRLDAVLSYFDARGDYDVALPPLPARGDGQPALSHGCCARIWPTAARRG